MIGYMHDKARRSLDGLVHSDALFVVERRGLEPLTLCLQTRGTIVLGCQQVFNFAFLMG